MTDVADLVPSVDDIALLLASRTTDKGGAEQDTFDDTTRPTGDQVSALSLIAAQEVLSALGMEDIPPAIIPDVIQLVALKTASLIEISFFDNSGTSAAFIASYTAGLGTLQDHVRWVAPRL